MAYAPYSFGEKDPASQNDPFTFDLTAWLQNPVTVSGTVYQIVGAVTATATPAGLTIGSVVYFGGYVTVYLSGGVSGVTYTLYIHVTRADQGGNLDGPIAIGATVTCITPVPAQ